MTVHLPDTFNPSQTAGTACGLIFGDERWSFEDDCVITEFAEWEDVDCIYCHPMIAMYAPMGTVPHPQPVTLRVHELAREAGQKSAPVLEMLRVVGRPAKTPASKVELLGFEHEALLALLVEQ